MQLRQRIKRQERRSMVFLENLTGGLPESTIFSEKKQRVQVAQLKNLTSALSRYIAQKGRVGFMMTLTFGKRTRIDLESMDREQVVAVASRQYDGCMAFLYKMRKSKRIKDDIRYMAVMELQSDGNLHMHIFLSVVEEDMFGLLAFVYDFKHRHVEPYQNNNKEVYPIGRLHIGISARYESKLKRKYSMQGYEAKSVKGKTEYYLFSLESRSFQSGDWTPIEFYTEAMIRERYDEKITHYLIKTFDGGYALDEISIKEGVAKCQIGHDTKTLYASEKLAKLQMRFIRMVGRRVYTHSRLPVSFAWYQKHFKELVALDPEYRLFYKVIQDVESGKLKLWE